MIPELPPRLWHKQTSNEREAYDWKPMHRDIRERFLLYECEAAGVTFQNPDGTPNDRAWNAFCNRHLRTEEDV